MTITTVAADGEVVPASLEPVLAVGEIQGNVLPGFERAGQALVFVGITDGPAARRWLSELPVTSLADVLAGGPPPGTTWTNVALSYRGVSKVRDDADRMTDMPFKRGLAARAGILGDPSTDTAPGHPSNWIVGRPGQPGLDAMVLVAGDDHDTVESAVVSLTRSLPAGLAVVHVERGHTRPAPKQEHEHFGYRDNISQPGVRGRLSASSDEFLTPRVDPGDPHQGGPGQQLVWPGEFVFGYPGQDALDRLRPGPIAVGGPPWTDNGSLLVFRRLRQDVEGFHRFLEVTAADLAARHHTLADLTPERLAAKLMGRWPSGAPIVATPEVDDSALGADPMRRNDFRFSAPSDDSSPEELGDPHGLMCPRAAHARRAYPRGAATASLTEASIETHRILRRGITFRDETVGDRGLLFLAYQTSFERQFEHITRAWLNNPHLHAADDGHDPIVGQAFGAYGDRERRFTIPVREDDGSIQRVPVSMPNDWVVPTGGGYFFAPAIDMLRDLAP